MQKYAISEKIRIRKIRILSLLNAGLWWLYRHNLLWVHRLWWLDLQIRKNLQRWDLLWAPILQRRLYVWKFLVEHCEHSSEDIADYCCYNCIFICYDYLYISFIIVAGFVCVICNFCWSTNFNISNAMPMENSVDLTIPCRYNLCNCYNHRRKLQDAKVSIWLVLVWFQICDSWYLG